MNKKSYLQPDFVDVQVEDTTQFNDIEEGIEIHRETFDKDIDDIAFEPELTPDEETGEDIYGYYN